MGIGPEADKLFLIDLELAAKYCDPHTHEHIPFSTYVSFVGNPIYASKNKILGNKVSRRDDLYSIGLVYFLRGALPWSSLTGRPGRRGSLFEAVKALKMKCSTESLTKGLPIPVRSLLTHAEGLPFETRPDYEGMRQLFLQFNARMGNGDVFPATALLYY